MSAWPPELDAVIAAPKHHRLVMENDEVRVLETLIRPGDTVPLHTHQWSAVNYLLSWSDFVRRDETGAITLDTREKATEIPIGSAMMQHPLPPHTLENVGHSPIHVMTVELKR